MRYAELCAGYGGLSLAIEDVFPGAELAWYSEFDPAPSKIMARHWPDAPNGRSPDAIRHAIQREAAAGAGQGTSDHLGAI